MKTIHHSDSPVEDLKSIIGFFDSEITDEAVRQLNNELVRLNREWKDDKALGTFLKIIRAMGKYLGLKKTDAHEESIPVLYSIFGQLETIVNMPESDLTPSRKTTSASNALKKFNALKKKIAAQAKKTKGTVKTAAVKAPDIESLKAVILSLDWEISDETILNLDKEVNALKVKCKGRKVINAFLDMILNLGNYIGSKKSGAHNESISLLHSVFMNFESVILTPSMPAEKKKEILRKERKKFDDLKKKISSPTGSAALTSQDDVDEGLEFFVSEETDAGELPLRHQRPMDDLISTKVDSASPVDDLVDAIHLQNVLDDDRQAKEEIKGLSGLSEEVVPIPSDMKEVVPNRLDVEPIPEIESRLDEFFDEDEKISELSFADSGETVVPYNPDDESGKVISNAAEIESALDSFKDESEAGSLSGSEGVVPFKFDEELYEETTQVPDFIEDTTLGDDVPSVAQLKAGIEELEKGISESGLKKIDNAVALLKQHWENRPNRLIFLEMIDSVGGYVRLKKSEPESETFDLLRFIHNSLEQTVLDQESSRTSGDSNLINAFSRYIELHSIIIRGMFSSLPGEKDVDETLSGLKSFQETNEPMPVKKDETELTGRGLINGNEDEPDSDETEKQRPERTGVLSGIKALFGFGKQQSKE